MKKVKKKKKLFKWGLIIWDYTKEKDFNAKVNETIDYYWRGLLSEREFCRILKTICQEENGNLFN